MFEPGVDPFSRRVLRSRLSDPRLLGIPCQQSNAGEPLKPHISLSFAFTPKTRSLSRYIEFHGSVGTQWLTGRAEPHVAERRLRSTGATNTV